MASGRGYHLELKQVKTNKSKKERIVRSEDRQGHGHPKAMNYKHSTQTQQRKAGIKKKTQLPNRLFGFECFFCYIVILDFLYFGSNATDERLLLEMYI